MGPGSKSKSVIVTITFFISLCFPSLFEYTVFAQSGHSRTIEPGMASRWSELLQRAPYPYHRPLPPESRSPIDGTFVKFDPKPFPHVPCRRCPDYVPEGGIWKLQFDRGIMRIFHAETGWRSISSFAVKEDRLLLFNDPHCLNTVGSYTWRVERRQLVLELIEDTCAIGMRGKNLAKQPWNSCQPNEEAATAGHWPVRPGCD